MLVALSIVFWICGGYFIGTKICLSVKWLFTHKPKKIDPVNVINGMIFPLPDDPRWLYKPLFSHATKWHKYVYDKIKFDDDWEDRIEVDREILTGTDVAKYLQAVKTAQQQQKAQASQQKAERYLTELLERDISKDIETDQVDKFKHMLDQP